MSRPLRIQYPDAWYHVMNRGRRGEKVFEGKNDYNAFIELLKDLVEDYKVNIVADARLRACALPFRNPGRSRI